MARSGFPALLLLLFGPALLLPTAAAAQAAAETPLAVHAVYLELGGHARVYSLNYDRRLGERLSLRAGATSVSLTDWEGTRISVLAFPVGLNVLVDEGLSTLFGGAGRMAEFGPGLIVGREGNSPSSEPHGEHPLVALSGTLGLRLQRPTSGWMMRAGYTGFLPLVTIEKTLFTGRSAGISVGYSF